MSFCLCVLAVVPAAAEPGLSVPPDDKPRWKFSVKPPVKDSLEVFEADFGFKPNLAPKQVEVSPWALDLDSRLIARADSLDLETYRSFRDVDNIRGGWNSRVNTMLRKTELERRGELRIGLALPSAMESIVGEGGAGLRVSGYRKILFTGRSQWTDKASTATVRQSKFPSLSMEQLSKFTVEGTIGSKISVKVDQDSKRTSDLENRIIIRYKGDEDDVLQSVDLGNTTLSLSDARFIGYSQHIQGLFGISATGRVGPVDFKMIASQEKGNTSSSRLVAGANEQSIIIRDYAYERYRFFDLGLMGDTNVLAPGDTIVEFMLFQSVSNNTNTVDPFARAHADWRNPGSEYPIEGRFRAVSYADPVEYDLYPGAHYIRFPRRLSNIENTALAYYMVYRKADGRVLTVGNIVGDTLDLQILKVHHPSPSDALWDAEWRNVYELRIRDINYEDLDLNIFKGLLGDEINPSNLDHLNNQPYLRLFDLDRTNASGGGVPDGKIDDNRAILDLTEGLLIFPDRRPFANADRLGDQTVPEIYTDNNSDRLREVTKYYIQITTRQRSKQLQLGVVNILDGSEVITYNGHKLYRGSDYDIDYDLGTVTFKRDDVLDPNATVTVDYEYAPFMTVEKRSLFGFSTTFDGGQNLRAGATLLYKGTKATDRPAQLGQEPFRDIVGEVFLNWRTDVSFLTSLADALPLISTDAPSTLDFQGAVARSFPNPNTKGVVYIDDFQGAKQAYSLGILRESWTLASPPLLTTYGSELRNTRGAASDGLFSGLSDPAVIWTNPDPQFIDTAIYVRDPDRSDGRQRNTHVFIMEFRPQKSPTITADGDRGEAWGGVMRALPVNLWDQSRGEFIELRMAVVSPATGTQQVGTLHLDLGQISEDVNADGLFNTEDQIIDGIRNKILDDGEDLGLDGLPDSLEIGPYGDAWDRVTNRDPALDNWPNPDTIKSTAELSRQDRINGTQNNLPDPLRGLRPDAEDIGGPSEFDRVNAYYQFSIDLGDPFDPTLVPESGKLSADRSGYATKLNWQTYRIPLWDHSFYERFADADSSNAIQFARLWLDGADTTVRIYIAAIDLVARTWTADLAKADPADSTGSFRLGVVNDEENFDYVSPPGVSGYEDPRSNFTETEQALLLEWQDLRSGDEGTASIIGTKEDYTGYRTLRMWVWADERAGSQAEISFSFGQNETNYYFYRDTLVWHPVKDSNWVNNRITIDFNELTALKDTAYRGPDGDLAIYHPGLKLGVVGNPSLTNIVFKQIGIIPLEVSGTGTHAGKVWCNELELVDPRQDAGLAASGKLTAQVADLLGFTASLEGQNYSFRGLTAGRTSSLVGGSSRLNTSISGNLNLHKFLPERLGISFPLAANYSKSVARPRLLTGSDIVLTPERQEEQKSTTISNGFTTRLSMRPKNAGWLMRSTIGALSTQLAASRNISWTPTTPMSEKESYTAGATYSLKFGTPFTIPFLYWTRYVLLPRRVWDTPLSLFPSDFTAGGTVRRQSSVVRNNRGLVTMSYTRDFVGNSGFGLRPIPAIQVNYDMSTTRDLADPGLIAISFNPHEFRLGRETGYSQRLQSSYRPTLFSFFSPSFTYNATFRDDIDKQYGDHDVNVDRNWSVSGTFDPVKFWGAMGAKVISRGARTSTGEQLPERYRQQLPQQDTTAADSTAVKKKKTSGGGGLGLVTAWRRLMNGMKWLTSPIGPLSVNYSKGDGDVRRDLLNRPSRLYQFGLNLDEEVPSAGNVATASLAQQSSRSQREGLNVRNDIDFLGILSFSNTYSRTTSKSIRAGSVTRKESETLPSLSTSLNRLERFKPIGWIFATASARFAYTRTVDQSFVGDARDNKVIGQNFSPLFSLRGTTPQQIQLDIVVDRTSSVSEPRISVSTKSVTRQVRVTSSYSFSSPNGIPLPFLRGLRLKSRMSLSLTVTHRITETFQERTDPTGRNLGFGDATQSNSDLSVSLNGNYSFSTRVRGGMKLEWVDRSTRSQGSGRQKSHVRAVSIWAEFSF